MEAIAASIRANANTIGRLRKRIDETMKYRGRSTVDRDEWSNACEEFHRTFPELAFPGGASRWEAFLARDPSETDTAVTFLEVDPRFFRSGYLKQIIWDRLKRAELTPEQELRLEGVAMAYIHRRVQREFWHMVRYVRVRGSASFWESITKLASQDAGEPSFKAKWLLLAKLNAPVRNWLGREFSRARYQPNYTPDLGLSRHET